ncbi:MAG: TIGR03545 family protein [Planctomycetaceae bacterium]|nr:TIGR03545 family protein [Planctomycetaceae bacterium]
MRWTYIIPRLTIVGLLLTFLTFGVDPLLQYVIVQSFQSVTGAKVDVAELKTTYFPPSFAIQGLALASASRPGKNLVEFDSLHVSFEPHSLSRRRFVVEDGHIDGLRFDTRRNDDGQLETTEEPMDAEPSWITDKLTELGDEWLSGLESQVMSQLDPNNLETWRVGTGVYEKWDGRFDELVVRAKELEPRAKALKQDFENARKGDTLQQIEQYLTVAQEAELLLREAQTFRDDLKEIVPEVRSDFQLLNDARLHDQEKVRHTLALLKPDPRRISEALLGRTMYLRLQEVLTWVETIRDYQHGLQDQIEPPRRPGHDFDFWAVNPMPDFLLKSLRMTGTISVSSESVPFQALLTDVTEDPKLLGRPCIMSLGAEGSRPLRLKVTYDATREIPVAEMLADFRDTNELPLRAGNPEKSCLHAIMNSIAWQSRLVVVENHIQGHLTLNSRLDSLTFSANDELRPEIVEAANEVFADLRSLNATVQISGTIREPQIEMHSDVGEQVASGVKVAFTHQMEIAKEKLVAEVSDFADEQIQTLKNRFAADYDRLLRENKELIEKASEVQTLVASLRSGNVDARGLVKQVSNSSLIKDKDRAKLNGAMEKFDDVLSGQIPADLQKKIPQLPGTLSLPPGMLPTPSANSILQNGSLKSFLPTRPREASAKPQSRQ